MFRDNANTFVFCINDFDNDENLMYKNLLEFIKILLKSKYICTVEEEETGIIAVRYNHCEYCGYGNSIPYWLTPEEYECFVQEEEPDENE